MMIVTHHQRHHVKSYQLTCRHSHHDYIFFLLSCFYVFFLFIFSCRFRMTQLLPLSLANIHSHNIALSLSLSRFLPARLKLTSVDESRHVASLRQWHADGWCIYTEHNKRSTRDLARREMTRNEGTCGHHYLVSYHRPSYITPLLMTTSPGVTYSTS